MKTNSIVKFVGFSDETKSSAVPSSTTTIHFHNNNNNNSNNGNLDNNNNSAELKNPYPPKERKLFFLNEVLNQLDIN